MRRGTAPPVTGRALTPILLGFLLHAGAIFSTAQAAQTVRVGDLTHREGEIPVRLTGYGLVVGLDGTGDRSFGTYSGASATVHSVVNLLRRFEIEVPEDRLRLRNVAAVLVTAEVSPYLRPGGRFEVQVAALGDASTLRGGVLWITPLVVDPGQPPVATAQGPLYIGPDDGGRTAYARRGNSGRIPEGGILEIDLQATAPPGTRLLLAEPDLLTASRIAAAIVAAFGEGTARVEDPGAISLTPGGASAAGGDPTLFLAAIDTLEVRLSNPARIVIDAREGTIVAGGDARVGPAVVHHRGITLEVASAPDAGGDAGAGAGAGGQASPAGGAGGAGGALGFVRVDGESSVQEIAAGLHAAGARPEEVAAIFEALRATGALRAEVRIR